MQSWGLVNASLLGSQSRSRTFELLAPALLRAFDTIYDITCIQHALPFGNNYASDKFAPLSKFHNIFKTASRLGLVAGKVSQQSADVALNQANMPYSGFVQLGAPELEGPTAHVHSSGGAPAPATHERRTHTVPGPV